MKPLLAPDDIQGSLMYQKIYDAIKGFSHVYYISIYNNFCHIRPFSKIKLWRHSHVALCLHMLSYVPIWLCCHNLSLIFPHVTTSYNDLIKSFQKWHSIMKEKYSLLQIINFSMNINRSVIIFAFLHKTSSDT